MGKEDTTTAKPMPGGQGKPSFLKRRWKVILNIVTLVALVVLVYAIREQLLETFANLGKVHAWALLLILPAQALNYHAQTRMYQGLFGVVGNKLKYGFLFRVGLELNFVNHVFPSGGVTGISYYGARLKSEHITASKASLVQMMKLILYLLSFVVLLLFGLIFMAAGNRVNDLVIMVTTLVLAGMVMAIALFAFIIGSASRIKKTFTYGTQLINKLIHAVRPRAHAAIDVKRVEASVLDLHENYKLIQSRYRDLKATFMWALVANVTEILTIYAVYLAFGEWVNIGAVILAYGVANFAGLVSIMPGGAGVYEALMTGVLVAAGVPARLSLPVTVMYRVLSTLLQVPIGYYFYAQNLRKNKSASEQYAEMHDDAA
jgi:putative heme transporter